MADIGRADVRARLDRQPHLTDIARRKEVLRLQRAVRGDIFIPLEVNDMPDASTFDPSAKPEAMAVSNVSGGVNLDAQRDVNIGGDGVGRNKVNFPRGLGDTPVALVSDGN